MISWNQEINRRKKLNEQSGVAELMFGKRTVMQNPFRDEKAVAGSNPVATELIF